MKGIVLLLILISFNVFAKDFNSLSCSKDRLEIFYINGINAEVSDAKKGSDTIRNFLNQIIKEKSDLKDSSDTIKKTPVPVSSRFDSNNNIFVDYEYNTSEGFNRDLTQLVEQKLAGEKNTLKRK